MVRNEEGARNGRWEVRRGGRQGDMESVGKESVQKVVVTQVSVLRQKSVHPVLMNKSFQVAHEARGYGPIGRTRGEDVGDGNLHR